MPLNLNSDKLIVVVKPEQNPVVYTGGTTMLVNVGSGQEIYAGLQGTASKIRTLTPGLNMSITTVGDEIVFSAGVTGSTFQIIGSGATTASNPSGQTWVVNTPPTDLSEYWTAVETQEAIDAATSGITSTTAWSGLTGHPTDNPELVTLLGGYTTTGTTADLQQSFDTHSGDTSIHTTMLQVNTAISAATSGLTSSWTAITDKPSWLSGTTLNNFQLAHQHSQYLTGFTVTPPMVTGITASLYAPIIHTHDYDTLQDLPDLFSGNYDDLSNKPTLFSGNYDDLSNKPDLSIYLTGFTVTPPMVTGITATLYAPIVHTHDYDTLTDLPDLFSGNYNDLSNKPDLSVYQPVSGMSIYLTGFTVTPPMVTGITASLYAPIIHTHVIADITNLDLSQYQPVSGMTDYLPSNALDGYWDSTETQDAIDSATSGLTSSWTTLEDKPVWLDKATVDAFQTGHTHSYNNLSDKPSLFTGNTFIASGATEISKVGDVVTIYSPIPTGSTGGTAYNFIASGATEITVDGNDVTIYTNPTGSTYTFEGSGATTVVNTTGNHFIIYSATGGTGGGSMATLSDVELTSIATNDILKYSGSTWVNEAPIDIFASVADTELLSRSGNTIAGVSQSKFVTAIAVIKTVTGTTYTALSADNAKIIEFSSASPVNITLPTGLTIGYQISIINYSTSVKTFVAGTGVTINSKGGNLKLSTIYNAATAYYKGSGIWVVMGDLTAA